MAVLACGALATRWNEAERDGVADAKVADALTKLLDDSGALVARHSRQVVVPKMTVDEVDV
ncbi:MAG: hypothetical protein OXH75_05685 [Acidobacteria bacterium]|nr:hypothetical protein [Acidobacteriota bacterium]